MSCGPPTIGVPWSMRLIAADSMKRQDDVSLRVAVECAAVARATCRQLSRLVAGRPQLTTMRYCLLESSNDRQPACASWLDRQRRGAAGVHQHHGAGALEALVAGMRRVRQRRAARVVIGQDGGEQGSVWVGPMPLNSAKLPSPWRKKRSIGIMRSMALSSAGGGAMLRARERGAQRQQVDQELDQRAGIAADVAAVGQDLALQLLAEPLGGAADVTLLARHAERRIGRARSRPAGAARRRAHPTAVWRRWRTCRVRLRMKRR